MNSSNTSTTRYWPTSNLVLQSPIFSQLGNIVTSKTIAIRLVATLALALTAIVLWLVFSQSDKSFESRGFIDANYLTDTKGQGDLIRVLNPMLAGEIAELTVSPSDQFEKGDDLFRVTTTLLQHELKQIETQRKGLEIRKRNCDKMLVKFEVEFAKQASALEAEIIEAKQIFEFQERNRVSKLALAKTEFEQARSTFKRRLKVGAAESQEQLELSRSATTAARIRVEHLRIKTPDKHIQTLIKRRDFQRAKYETRATAKEHDRLDLSNEIAVSTIGIKRLELLIKKAKVKAPYDGIVLSSTATVGNWVDTDYEVLKIAPLPCNLLLKIHVKPQHIGKVRPKQIVEFFPDTFDRVQDQPLTGHILEIPADVSINHFENIHHGDYVVIAQLQLDELNQHRVKIGTPCQCSIIVDQSQSRINWWLDYLLKLIHEP